MTISRNGILLLSLLAIALVHFVPRIIFYISHPILEGEIVTIEKSKPSQSSTALSRRRPSIANYTPYARIEFNQRTYTIRGPVYYDLESCPKVSEKIKLLFVVENPYESKFLNLAGFWFEGYIWRILAFLGLIILITTFLRKDQKVIFHFNRKENKKFIEVTVSAEQIKSRKLSNWAMSQIMFGKKRNRR